MQLIRVFIFCAMLVFALTVHAKRIALVMGNDNYISVSKLQKAGNDASAMARELKSAGFTVQLHRDLNYRGMLRAVETFGQGIKSGDEVVVFFAGHGVQIKNGNYLLPTDIEVSSEGEVEKTAYELLALTEQISEAKPAFSLVIIDACRDNPLKNKVRSVGNVRGLSAIEPAKGQMVVYSASRGQQALDRLVEKDPNPNSVFTRELISRMKTPGLKIDDLMREVQDSVEALAKVIRHEQRPAIYSEARGNFYFYQKASNLQSDQLNALPSFSDERKEEMYWKDVKSVGNKEAFEAYLSLFPNGRFAPLAKASILRFSQDVVSQLPQSDSLNPTPGPVLGIQSQQQNSPTKAKLECRPSTQIDNAIVTSSNKEKSSTSQNEIVTSAGSLRRKKSSPEVTANCLR